MKTFSRSTLSKALIMASLSLGLIACSDDDDNTNVLDTTPSNTENPSNANTDNSDNAGNGDNTNTANLGDFYAGLALRAADYSSGSWGSLKVSDGQLQDYVEGIADGSDTAIDAYDNQLFYLARFNMDYVARVKASEPNNVLLQNTANDDGETGSNPYQVVVESAERGYLIRYGSSTAWVINPMASTGEAFKTGEIDLSALVPNATDADSNPEMHGAVISQGKLFIGLQNLASFSPETNASVAVYDLATQQLIDTDPSTPDIIDPIALPIENSQSLELVPNGDTLLINGIGRYQSTDWTTGEVLAPAQYTGGIVSVNLSDYSAQMLLDDGDADNHPYGQISSLTLVDSDTAFFVGYQGAGQETLYPFNPETGLVGAPVAGYEQVDMGSMAVSPDGNLWMGFDERDTDGNLTHTLRVINPDSLEQLQRVVLPASLNGMAFANAAD